jgi:hypothetical protein
MIQQLFDEYWNERVLWYIWSQCFTWSKLLFLPTILEPAWIKSLLLLIKTLQTYSRPYKRLLSSSPWPCSLKTKHTSFLWTKNTNILSLKTVPSKFSRHHLLTLICLWLYHTETESRSYVEHWRYHNLT